MRKILLLLALGVFDVAAFAQKADTGRVAAPQIKQLGLTTPWWFYVALPIVIGGMIYLFWRNSRRREHDDSKGLGIEYRNKHAHSNKTATGLGQKKAKKKSGFTDIQNAVPTGAVPMTAGVEKIQKTAVPEEPEAQQPQEVPPQASAAPVAQPAPKAKPEPPKPEIFYMTVPAADGSFPVGAKKMQPNGCLYQFEVQPGKPTEARICFAGSETDMGNAQAFRDLELLPACTFSNLPQGSGFRFEQTPGRALLDKGVWVVKEKIAIKFV